MECQRELISDRDRGASLFTCRAVRRVAGEDDASDGSSVGTEREADTRSGQGESVPHEGALRGVHATVVLHLRQRLFTGRDLQDCVAQPQQIDQPVVRDGPHLVRGATQVDHRGDLLHDVHRPQVRAAGVALAVARHAESTDGQTDDGVKDKDAFFATIRLML